MCTVTYIPETDKRGFILTSNRDEKSFRPTVPPEIYRVESTKVCFPKDAKAGGSWIAMNDKGRLCCLLNGAFEAHQKKHYHTRSRGTVLTGFASTQMNVSDYFNSEDLSAVEPFTIIVVEQEKGQVTGMFEFVWDGNIKHVREPDLLKPALWSSVTLYSAENRKHRQEWFRNFLESNNGSITPANVFEFHAGTHTSDNSVNLVMERVGGLKTVSITQVTTYNETFIMTYCDLINNSEHLKGL
jgi:hypothetical protein